MGESPVPGFTAAPLAPPTGGPASGVIATAISTVVINGSSAAVAVIIARNLGRTAETDGFFVAYGIYLVITLAAAAIRILLVPTFTRADRDRRLGGEALGFAGAIAVPAAVALAVGAIAANFVEGSATANAFADALPWLLCAGLLQLFAGLIAAVLAARNEYVRPAIVYAAGSVASLAVFASLLDHGLPALLWGQLVNALICVGGLGGLMLRHRVTGRKATTGFSQRLAVVARTVAVPVALQALYAIAAALATRLGTGEATTFNYAFFFASFLVSATSTPLALVSTAPLTRRGLATGDVAAHVVAACWLSLPVIAAAVGVFSLVGTRAVEAALGRAYSGSTGHDIVTVVIALVPWVIGSVGVNVAYPLVFVADRQRLIFISALLLPLLELLLGVPLAALAGLPGLAIAVAIPTLLALVVFVGTTSRRDVQDLLRGVTGVASVTAAAAAAAFGIGAVASSGAEAAAIGAALYVAAVASIWSVGPRGAWTYLQGLR